MKNPTAARNADLAAIHIAQKALGLSKEDAAALKVTVVGLASSADMTPAQRRRYLAHLSSLQSRRAGNGPPAAPRPAMQRSEADADDGRWTKARALWHLLARAGHVRTDTDAALMAYVTRQTQMAHWRFLNGVQINTLIESLKRWCRRTGVEILND